MISADGRVFAGGCGRSTCAADGATVIVGVCCWRNAKPRPASTAMVSTIAAMSNQRVLLIPAHLGSKPRRNLIGNHGLPFVGRTPQVRLHLIGRSATVGREHRDKALRASSAALRIWSETLVTDAGTGVSYHVGPMTSARWPPSLILLIASMAPSPTEPDQANASSATPLIMTDGVRMRLAAHGLLGTKTRAHPDRRPQNLRRATRN